MNFFVVNNSCAFHAMGPATSQMAHDPPEMALQYERLQYVLVPTYVPIAVLVVRSIIVACAHEISRHFLAAVHVRLALTALTLYVDSLLAPKPGALERYMGGVWAIALALLTRGAAAVTRFGVDRYLILLVVDGLWVGVSAFRLFLLLRSRGSSTNNGFGLLHWLAITLGVIHVALADNSYDFEILEFITRIFLFYTCGTFLYALRGVQDRFKTKSADSAGLDPGAHAALTLHCALPSLWVHVYLLPIHFVTASSVLMWLVISRQALRDVIKCGVNNDKVCEHSEHRDATDVSLDVLENTDVLDELRRAKLALA